jgi:hypothetical protein
MEDQLGRTQALHQTGHAMTAFSVIRLISHEPAPERGRWLRGLFAHANLKQVISPRNKFTECVFENVTITEYQAYETAFMDCMFTACEIQSPLAAETQSQGVVMSVRKELSGRHSVQVQVEVPGSTQSAVVRQSAEAQLRTLIAKFTPGHLRLIGAMRRWLRKRLPTANEVVYEYRDCFVISYSPNERGYEGVLAIRASGNGVRLYFNRGKELPDPEKLLRGSGNQTRWIDMEGASTLARPEVARLTDQAMARNRVPFALAGRGSVVIRSASAKQRQQHRPA